MGKTIDCYLWQVNQCYKNITDEQFEQIKDRLMSIEVRIDSFLPQIAPEFSIDKSHDYESSLSININSKTSGFGGNISIIFKDEAKDEYHFNVGIVKTRKVSNLKFYKKERIFENITLSQVENEIESILSKAFSVFFQWKETDLNESMEVGTPYYPSGKGKGLRRYYP